MTIDMRTQMRLSITASAADSARYVQILGDVDLSDARALRIAAAQLIHADATVIYIDLGGTTFMGSTLVAFLVHVGTDSTTQRQLVLCRPTPMARRVITMTGLDELATVRPDLPPQWPVEVDHPFPVLRAV